MEIKKTLILISDYFLSAKKGLYVDIVFPLIVGIGSYFLFLGDFIVYNKVFIGSIITVLGIISGFGISSISLLLASDKKSVVKYKTNNTNIIIDGEVISYFRRLYILICYSTIVSFIGVLFFFFGGLVLWNKFLSVTLIHILKSFSIAFVSHILIINIRGIASLYLMYVNEANESNE